MKDLWEKVWVLLWTMVAIGGLLWIHYHQSTEVETCEDEPAVLTEVEESLPSVCDEPTEPIAPPAPKLHLVSYNGRPIRYSKQFADKNELHLSAAQRLGLPNGLATRAQANMMSNQLCEVRTNDWYVVEELTHSVPYLVPIAAHRLDSIGKEFNALLKRNQLPHYRFRVTSVLRSQEDISCLQRCNHNATSNSAHNYGTTFDIGYWHYDKVEQTCDSMTDDNLKLALGQVLLNQQRAGNIYVKYEYKQSCFHITVRN